MSRRDPYVPPPYPYDRLNRLKPFADRFAEGLINLSIGAPADPPPAVALNAMATSDAERGYPPSIGLPEVRASAASWLNRRFGVDVPADSIAATIGSKEFVATVPKHLHLRRPDRDTILYPAVSYPSYAMGAELAGLRAVPVPVDENWRIDLDAIEAGDAARALCLWVNTPGNPAGALDDLGKAATWGRQNDVLVLSDECYIEFTWEGQPRTILHHGNEGVLAVHSLSKRSNFAGGRFGFYAGDPEWVHFLSEVRKHSGCMVPGPVQHAARAALDDDAHVDAQRAIYRRRLEDLSAVLAANGLEAPLPEGGFYLWVRAPRGDAWALAELLATRAGTLVSPGEFYGDLGAAYVRLALVDDRIELVESRLAANGGLV